VLLVWTLSKTGIKHIPKDRYPFWKCFQETKVSNKNKKKVKPIQSCATDLNNTK
jgi:hypothetical protein